MNGLLCGSEQTPEKGWSGLREHVSKTREHFLYALFFDTLEPSGGFEMAAH